MDRAEFLKWAAEVMGADLLNLNGKLAGLCGQSINGTMNPLTSRDDFHRLLVAVREKEPRLWERFRECGYLSRGGWYPADVLTLPLSPFSADYIEGETLCGLLWEAKERKER